MANIKVSAQAFLQEIQNWISSLNRQTKKLHALKSNVKNKFKLNSIEIVLTEIQSIQIKYKKIKKKYHPFVLEETNLPNSQIQNQKLLLNQLLSEYSQLSKIFMEILQKITIIENQSDQPNFLLQNYQDENENRKKSQSVINQGDKTFLNDTFAFKVSKERKDNNKSMFDKRKTNMQKQSVFNQKSSRIKTHSVLTRISDVSKISVKNQPGNKKIKTTENKLKSQVLDEKSTNLWQIRHQLQTITQMMKEMKNEIKYHEHEQTNREINKIETKNRKMASQLKSIREENRIILDKLEQLKNDLNEEKKAQVDLINKFQKRTGNSKYNLYDSIATHADNYASVQGDKSSLSNRKSELLQDVSDWVKMRI